jgi:hypothetical protein
MKTPIKEIEKSVEVSFVAQFFKNLDISMLLTNINRCIVD